MTQLLRKIPFISALALLGIGITASAAAAPTPAEPSINLKAAKSVQKGRSVVLIAETERPLNLKRLRRFPDLSNNKAPYLCFSFRAGITANERLICLGGKNRPLHKVGLMRVDTHGNTVGKNSSVKVSIKRRNPTSIVVTLLPSQAGLKARNYEWKLIARQGGRLCKPGRATRRCFESLPAGSESASLTIKAVVPIGCTAAGSGIVTHGPRNAKVVALTFDDGPSIYTNRFLDVLRAKKVRGTFYLIGTNLAGRTDTARRIVAEGHEVANHSWKHDLYPGYADLHQTSAAITEASGFKPCTFRPPGGAQNASVVSGAGRAGMTTVIWDVDPFDWRLPGSNSIYNSIVQNVRPGSIVLSHDGGGDRAQTLAALPRIIDNLKSRGYSFTTVAELLGGKFRYGAS